MRGVDRMQMQRRLQLEIAGITRPLLRIHTDLSGKRTELLIQLYPFSPVSEHRVPAFLFAANMTEQQIHKDIMYHFPDFAKIIEEEQDT